MTPADRAAHAENLRSEAVDLLTQTGLFQLLELRFGRAVVTGSAGYDLMVRRDLDIHMPVEGERWAEWAAFGGELALHFEGIGLQLHKATFLNDHVEPQPQGAGLCWAIAFRDFAGNPWTCDLWGWEPLDFQIRLSRDDVLRADLKRADRDLILKLKSEACEREDYYGVTVSGYDIYQFAIAQAGDTLDELEDWKQQAAE
jgi:hypothetical protein